MNKLYLIKKKRMDFFVHEIYMLLLKLHFIHKTKVIT